ncbi:MAG: hypothetical protein M0Z30_08695 [Actinomycetota bacterium]|nr:hypothetical protein [Actinomycetota bacterium]
MSPARRPAGTRPARHGWMDLLQTTGPWLTVPVVERILPDGPARVPTPVRHRLRAAVLQALADNGASRQRVVEDVLADALDWAGHLRLSAQIPDSLAEPVPEHTAVVRPSLAFYAEPPDQDDGEMADVADDTGSVVEDDGDTDREGPGDPGSATAVGPWRLLGMLSPWGTHPLARVDLDGWAASPVERLATLLRARDVPVGLVTDGRWWTVVWAPRGATVATATWDAGLWSEEPETLDGFVALLERARFLAVPAPDTLPALFRESLDRQEEITEGLGRQVRDAVELLVTTLDTLDKETGRTLLAAVTDDELYDGAVTVMMRLVFLLFAEERRLLPSDDGTYLDAYSVGRLVDKLEDRAALTGEAALEYSTSAWHRLLAVSRAVHQGIAHEDLRLPAYGGGLFDPDRYPWLEGRTVNEPPNVSPPRVDDRTVLRMLRAVQFVDIGGQRRRLTFRSLDVEQIGYVYEGLLELEVRTAESPMVLLARPAGGKRPKAPGEVTIADWSEALDELTPAEQTTWLTDRTGWSAARATRTLDATLEPPDRNRLGAACDGDHSLADLLTPLYGALRPRPDGRPAILDTGGRYLAASLRRAATGTHYTARSLAEDIAGNAIEPLVYRPGPLETSDRAAWRLRPSSEILALRVADIAMGSGAFLVAACRYLADRLLEAWDAEGRTDAQRAVLARAGRSHASDAEVEPVLLDARRLVTEHCLYGTDINPLAVEMAKLSLWLITMDRQRPFGFLDDRLRCGDSLLGLVAVDQLEYLHLDPSGNHQLHSTTPRIRPLLASAADIRRRITAQSVVSARDVEHKASLLAEAEALTADLATIADAVTATGLVAAGRNTRDQALAFALLADRVDTAVTHGNLSNLRREADTDLQRGRPAGTTPRRTLQWPLAFPEVFADNPDPGFDAIIGNPPFLGGSKISGHLGADYRQWLQVWDARNVKGNADLVASFVLRSERLLSRRGQLGCIAVNTLVQGDTLEVGLLRLSERGITIRRGRASHKWPSRSANLEIIDLWASRTEPLPAATCWLDGEEVPHIGPDLEPIGSVTGRPQRLRSNDDLAFNGSRIEGLGFTLTHNQAAAMLERDSRYGDVVQLYVIGRDINQRPDTSASRHVINFRDWSLQRCAEYPEAFEIIRRLVRPERERNNRSSYRDRWWWYGERRVGLYETIAKLDHVLAISLVGSTLLPVRMPTGQVFAHKCGVFAFDDFANLALLSSNVHATWVIRYTSTMRTDINYSPSDVFATFPRPDLSDELEELGRRLDTERRALMLGRSWGLTTTYNHVHDPSERDPEVVNLRDIHAAIDRAVFDAYGWHDLDPEIGYHRTKIGIRWTVSPRVRFEILDRLLAENHRRHAIESGHVT